MALRDIILATPGLIWLGELDETSGTTADDASAGARDGTYVASPTLGVSAEMARVPAAKAVTLNGSTQYVTVPGHASLEVGNTYSMEVRFKRTSPHTVAAGTVEALVAQGMNGPRLAVEGGRPTLAIPGVGYVMITDHSIRDTNWHHLIATKTGASSAAIYLDGRDISTDFANHNTTNGVRPWTLGAQMDAVPNPTVPAAVTMDYAAIYSAVLTASQVTERWKAISSRQDHKRARRMRYSKVAAYVPLNDPVGATTVAAQRRKRRLWDANSFFNRRLPDDHPIDAQSDVYAARIYQQAIFYGVGANIWTFSVPHYELEEDVSLVGVLDRNDGFLNGTNSPYKFGPANTPAAPWPSYIRSADAEVPAATYKDRNLSIMQAGNDLLDEYFSIHPDHTDTYDPTTRPYGYPNVSMTHGGRLRNLSTGAGIIRAPYGSAATGVNMAAGLIRLDELQQGVIPHAVRFAGVEQFTSFRSPAQRTDGAPTQGSRSVQAGSRFRLPYDFDVDAYAAANGTSPIAKMVMQAIKDYGLVWSDASGVVSIYLQDPRFPPNYGSDTSVYTPYMAGQAAHAIFDYPALPWDKLLQLPPW